MLSRFRKQSGKASGEVGPAQSALVEKPLAPKRRLLLGRTVGVFVTSDRVVLAAVRHLGVRRVVTAVTERLLDEGLSPDERSTSIGEAVAGFVATHGGKQARVQVCVAGHGTAFRTFLLPAMGKADLAAAVKIEAAKQVPFPPEDCHYGFSPITKLTSGESSRFRIALHAATKSVVRGAIGPLERLGVPVHTSYSASDAIAQLLPQAPGFDPNGTCTVLRIGQQDTETAFYRGGMLDFFHHGGTGASMLGENPEQAHLEYFAETLAGEIQTSFDYYAGQSTRRTAPEIYVCGVASENERLLALLTERVGNRFVPFPISRTAGVTLAEGIAATDAVAALPAVAAALCREELIDLLPSEHQTYWKMRRVDALGRLAVAGMVVLLGLGWSFLNRDLQIHQGEALSLQRQLGMFQTSAPYHTFLAVKTKMAASSRYLRATEKEPTYLAQNLKELSLLTPREVRLTRFDLGSTGVGGELRLQGVVESTETPPEVVLAEFVERLNASGFYDGVVVERHVKRRDRGRFQLDFQLQMQGII